MVGSLVYLNLRAVTLRNSVIFQHEIGVFVYQNGDDVEGVFVYLYGTGQRMKYLELLVVSRCSL